MRQKKIPLLEYDKNKNAKIRPEHFPSAPKNLPERCVVAFFSASVEDIAKKYQAKIIGESACCTCSLPIYELNFEGEKIALITGFLGSAGAAGQIDELCAGGVNKIVACGAAGGLTSQPLGALVVPFAAVRDEGTSFHYVPPSYEIKANDKVVTHITDTLKELEIPHVIGKTWTTDAIYRETEDKIALRRSQGCLTVEMECSAMIAVTQFREVEFGQILYCGDDLSGTEYDTRNFYDAENIRRDLVEIALKCVKNL